MEDSVKEQPRKVQGERSVHPRRRIAIGAAAFIGLLAVLYLFLRFVPCRTLTAFCTRQNSTRFYDRNGVLLRLMPLDEGLRREWYDLSDIPQALQQAFINAEDRNFYHHIGVDVASIVRALVQNKQAGRIVSGASTITMQLSRMVWPRTEAVSLKLKVAEMFRALFLEIRLTKKQILELYLNSVPFGFQIEGVGSAAHAFFSRDMQSLSLEQMETLAQIPRRPNDRAPEITFSYPALAPHFVNHVIATYRARGERIPDSLTLALDSALTQYAEKLIQKKLEEYSGARIHNGAAFVLDNLTGETLVWAGNASFEDETHSGQIDGVTVKNQPGSSMKPFLYALALETKFAPSSVLPDIPQDFGGKGVYVPLNFNNRYNGPVRFRVSLASSLNVTAVYVLYKVGLETYMNRLFDLGFDSLKGTEESTGLSIALGSSEVTLEEMVRAFSVFANDGMLVTPRYVKVAPDGQPVQKNRRRVYNADTARILCDILSDESARTLGFGHAAVFDTPYPALFKTGTSNQFQNIIALGSTSRYTVGVWMGNFGGETVVGQTGSSIPAHVVRNLLDNLTRESGAKDFKVPEHYEKKKVCSLSGLAPSPSCPSVSEEYVKKGVALEQCNWHYSENGRVKIHYPSLYQHWAQSKNFLGKSGADGSPLMISYPRNNALYVYDPSLPAGVQAVNVKAVGGSASVARLFVDDEPAGTAEHLFAWNVPLHPGRHTLTVVCGNEQAQISYTVE